MRAKVSRRWHRLDPCFSDKLALTPMADDLTVPRAAQRCLILLLALLMPLAAPAAPATYTGGAPVNSQSDPERTEALKTALANIVIEQTGDSSVLARGDVAQAVGRAERYVLQYTYRPNHDPAAPAPLTLVAQFDAAAVDRMLSSLGFGTAAQQALAPAPPSEATVWIGGIDSADQYAQVMGYLVRSNFVKEALPTAARRDGILVRLSLSTDLPHSVEAIDMERTLAAAPAPPPIGGADAVLALAR